jgi:hypothetical protein
MNDDEANTISGPIELVGFLPPGTTSSGPSDEPMNI